MDSSVKDKDVLKQMYKSGINAGFFNNMSNNKYTQKSKIQIKEDLDEEEIDQKTFRLMPNFKVPEHSIPVNVRKGSSYIAEQGFFSCLASRKVVQLELINRILTATYSNAIERYLDFDLVNAQVAQKGIKGFNITVEGGEKPLYFEPTAKSEVSEWVTTLSTVTKESDGKKFNYSYLSRNSSLFYKSKAISNEQFQKNANSGDVLLFRSEHSAARMQRAVTSSDYDHVGVVLRNLKNQLYVFESTSSQGVGLTPWRHMVKYEWYKSTEIIAWRRLHMTMNSQSLGVMEAYVAKTLGKGFEINLDKLFQFQSYLKRSDEEEEKKTYFCSELVARLYKELGLINPEKSSSQYYPVDFSRKGSINIIKQSVSLGDECVISFDGAKS